MGWEVVGEMRGWGMNNEGGGKGSGGNARCEGG